MRRQSILLIFFTNLSLIVYMVRCFFLLSHFLLVEDYELSNSKSYSQCAINSGMHQRILFWSIFFFFYFFVLFFFVSLMMFCVGLLFRLMILLSFDKLADFPEQTQIFMKVELNCNLILWIKMFGKYFYFLSATFLFLSVDIWYLGLSLKAQTLKAIIQT